MNLKKLLFWKKEPSERTSDSVYERKYYKELKEEIETAFKEKFGEKVTEFVTVRAMDKPFTSFSCVFKAYDYFVVWLDYDRGFFGCSIITGKYSGSSIKTEQKDYDNLDMEIFLNDFQKGMENRIPDKFLVSRGWK